MEVLTGIIFTKDSSGKIKAIEFSVVLKKGETKEEGLARLDRTGLEIINRLRKERNKNGNSE